MSVLADSSSFGVIASPMFFVELLARVAVIEGLLID